MVVIEIAVSCGVSTGLDLFRLRVKVVYGQFVRLRFRVVIFLDDWSMLKGREFGVCV